MAHKNIDVIDKQTLQPIKGQEKSEDAVCKNCPFILNIISLSHDLHIIVCFYLPSIMLWNLIQSWINIVISMYQVLYIIHFIYCESSFFSLSCYFESYKVFDSNNY